MTNSEKENKQAIKAKERLDRQHARRQKKIDKARAKYHINDCPWCGAKRPAVDFWITYHMYRLECQKCYFRGATSRTIRGAIKKWNKIC